jgi:hypothetical protein
MMGMGNTNYMPYAVGGGAGLIGGYMLGSAFNNNDHHDDPTIWSGSPLDYAFKIIYHACTASLWQFIAMALIFASFFSLKIKPQISDATKTRLNGSIVAML